MSKSNIELLNDVLVNDVLFPNFKVVKPVKPVALNEVRLFIPQYVKSNVVILLMSPPINEVNELCQLFKLPNPKLKEVKFIKPVPLNDVNLQSSKNSVLKLDKPVPINEVSGFLFNSKCVKLSNPTPLNDVSKLSYKCKVVKFDIPVTLNDVNKFLDKSR